MNKSVRCFFACLITFFSLPAVSGIRLDTSFGDGGYVQTNVAKFNDSIQQTKSVLVQTDGKIVIAGIDYYGDDRNFALIRYNTDGTRDLGFGESGQVSTDFGGVEELLDLVQQANGKIVAAGWTTSNSILLIRYNIDGSVDETFGVAGKVNTDTDGRAIPNSIIVQDD